MSKSKAAKVYWMGLSDEEKSAIGCKAAETRKRRKAAMKAVKTKRINELLAEVERLKKSA